MKLKDLIKHLQSKSTQDQDTEVEYLVVRHHAQTIVTCDLKGPSTTQLMRVLAKSEGDRAQVE